MINLFYDDHDAQWEAWHDVEDDPKNGVCIGSGHTKTEALFKASLDLQHELNVIRELLRSQNDSEPKQKEHKPTQTGIRSPSTKIRHFKLWAKAMDPRYYRKITKKEHDDLIAQIDWILNRLANWPE